MSNEYGIPDAIYNQAVENIARRMGKTQSPVELAKERLEVRKLEHAGLIEDRKAMLELMDLDREAKKKSWDAYAEEIEATIKIQYLEALRDAVKELLSSDNSDAKARFVQYISEEPQAPQDPAAIAKAVYQATRESQKSDDIAALRKDLEGLYNQTVSALGSLRSYVDERVSALEQKMGADATSK